MIDLRAQKALIVRGHVLIPHGEGRRVGDDVLATLMSNLSYYGFSLSARAFEQLRACPAELVAAWWADVELVLATLTGDDRDMGEFVVYKNFPAEVLEMGQAQYWISQLLMYWGLPNALFTQPVQPRAPLAEPKTLRVLHPGSREHLSAALLDLLSSPSRWSADQWEDVSFLALELGQPVPLSKVPFKENMTRLGVLMLAHRREVQVSTATDALRLAYVMSGHSADLRNPMKLRAFKRPERRFLLAALECATHLEADFSRRPEQFKRLMHALHPFDYKARYPKVAQAADRLYKDALDAGYLSALEEALRRWRGPEALALLKQRPGEFSRRLHHAILLFGLDASRAFVEVLDQLSTARLLSLERYLMTINQRQYRLFTPRGSWSALRILKDGQPYMPPPARVGTSRRAERFVPPPRSKRGRKAAKRALAPQAPKPKKLKARKINGDNLGLILEAIKVELGARLRSRFDAVALDERTAWIKLPDNDAELMPWGRGTRFPIPEGMSFVRTASYWSIMSEHYVWFDNGWSFFDAEWRPLGVCTWDWPSFRGATFSGDPTNTKDLEGRACQMIDLDLERLRGAGVAYAVWGILAYSRITFSQADDVFAALLWGKDPQAGKLFEPSRCQLAFPLKGDGLVKYIVYLDLEARQLVYLDANLRGDVTSAGQNTKRLGRIMPAMCEHLDAKPSVYDLFKQLPKDTAHGVPILYDDSVKAPRGGQPAYVFKPLSEQSEFTPIELGPLLSTIPSKADKS